MIRRTLATISFLFASVNSVFAAGGGGHVLPLYPDEIIPGIPISNSMIMVWIAAAILVLFCRAATKKMDMVPSGIQNFCEWVIESLYDFFENILGAQLVKRTFWFFGSVFLLILTVNYLALIPGVGTIGRYDSEGHFVGFLRGGNADLNMTAAMSLTFALLWFYWAITENGIKGFFAHIFAPKGEFKGPMLVMMIPIFLAVGVLEMISIAIRPLALSFRLFGNVYGGEQTLEKLMGMVPSYLAFLPALPFYFMELLIGLIQALVFALLTAVFLKLVCDHGDEEHH